MKNKTASLVTNVFVSIILSSSLVMCFATAFKLNVSWVLIVLSSTVFTLLFTGVNGFIKSKKIYFPVIIGLNILFLAFIFLNLETLVYQLNATVNTVFENYRSSFKVPESFSLMGLGSKEGENFGITGLFTVVSFIICEIFSISQIKWRTNLPIYIISLIPLVPCFVMVDTMPNLVPLFICIAILTAMYVTGIARKHSVSFENILMPVVSVIMIGVLVILSVIFPMENYRRYDWQEDLLNFFDGGENSTGLNSGKTRIITDISRLTDLENLGDFDPDDKTLFKVKADDDGTLYLKKETYSNFDGTTWSTILSNSYSLSDLYGSSIYDDRNMNDIIMFGDYSKPFCRLKITQSKSDNYKKVHIIATEDNSILLSTNYLRKNSEIIKDEFYYDLFYTDDYVDNLDYVNEYDLEYYPENSTDLYKKNSPNLSYYEKELLFYCTGNESFSDKFVDTKGYPIISENMLKQILKDINVTDESNVDIPRVAKLVEEYVRDIGTYSRHPDDYDPEMGTFPEWFIKNDGRGYCMHYATTAAAILRGIGIPARYVTGYCVEGKKDEYVDVSSENAHAWVEYYDENIGWRTLDPTPGTETITTANNIAPTTTSGETQPTTADAQGNTSNQNTEENSVLNWLIIVPVTVIVAVMAVLVFISLRAKRIRKKRKEQFFSGSNSERIVSIYRYAHLINELNQDPLPEEIYDIAVEAKYSNHNMNDKSVKIMTEFAKEQQMKLYSNCGKLKRIYYLYFKVI